MSFILQNTNDQALFQQFYASLRCKQCTDMCGYQVNITRKLDYLILNHLRLKDQDLLNK